jgi:hypothetical protein
MRIVFTGAKKCGGEKPHKGRSPTAVFRSPSRLLAAKRKQSCYAKWRFAILPTNLPRFNYFY